MDIFIPLHHACTSLESETYIPVVLDEDKADTQETYLFLYVDERAEFDLNIDQGGGKILAKPALHHAKRLNREECDTTDAEFYTARGKEIAQSLHFGSAVEYLAAWLNEDRKQANFCNDIHAVLSLDLLEKCPKWIRLDLLSILESEAMKQIFATRYFIEEKRENFKIPSSIRTVIKDSADNITDPLLSKLLSDVMQKPPRNSDAAHKFDIQAQARIKIFQNL
jgi:hypothetical protein